jgi:large subunit ribosomal protein L17
MRHLVKKSKKLGKGRDHRRKLLRTLASSVIIYEKIETTTANAKAIRSYVDKMITKAKKQSLHGRRQLLMDLTPGAAKKAAEVLADRYAQRNGGYCRILISGRAKDGMKNYLVELV